MRNAGWGRIYEALIHPGSGSSMTSDATRRQRRAVSDGPMLELLKRVSRSFYLTMRVLPRDMRRPIGSAYLLARAADIIADTRAVHSPGRLEVLRGLRNSIEHGTGFGAVEVSMMSAQASMDERDLLGEVAELVSDLRTIPLPDWDLVRDIVVQLTKGMEFDLMRFPLERRGEVAALETVEELDTYTYMVAGCVGEFWTDVTMRHTPPLADWNRNSMAALGVRFGKALQMTNVLRDTPTDLRIGRCYIPGEWLQDVGLTARDLLDPANAAAARPTLVRGIVVALEHFAAAETYLMSIPGRCARLRLAVAWPLLIGLATLEALAQSPNWLDPKRPSKVSRDWVYRMIGLSLPMVNSNTALRTWTRRLRRRVYSSLEAGVPFSQDSES